MVKLFLAYFQYRFNALFTIRKKEAFVGNILEYLKKGGKNIAFEVELQSFRKLTKRSKRTITIQDFGAGSKKMGNERSISNIYKNSVATLKFQRLFFHLIMERNSKNVLELGTSLGFTTVYLAKACLGQVTTIEACPAIHAEAANLFLQMNLKNVQVLNSTFIDYFENNPNENYDFVYIDGHHEGKALLNYIEILKPQLTENAIVVIDDIRWSKEMNEAWVNLTFDPYFESNVDLFRMGILRM